VRRMLLSEALCWARNHVEFWRVAAGMLVLVALPVIDLAWLPDGQYLGGSPEGSDFSFAMLPWWEFAVGSLRRGDLPLWNPYLSSGVPFVANPQPGLFYPPVWLITVLPATRVVGLLLILHMWLAGVGMYVWLRSEKLGEPGAWFGAVVFALSGYFTARVSAGQSDVVMTQSWLPWILFAINRAMNTRPWTRAVLAGIPVGFSLLAGHTATFLYVLVIAATYALRKAWLGSSGARASIGGRVRWWADVARRLLPTGVALLVGISLAAVQLVPTAEFLSLSTRADSGYDYASQYSWWPGYLITLLVPNFFGDDVNTGYWGDGIYSEQVLYVGVLPLLLLLAASAKFRHRLATWLAALGGVGLLVAFGRFGVLHHVVYSLVPLFGSGRVPARAGFLFTFALAALGGLLVSWLEGHVLTREEGRLWSVVGWTAGTAAGLAVAACFLLFSLYRDTNSQVGRLWHIANYIALFVLFLLLSTWLLEAWRRRSISARQWAILAVGLAVLDLWSFGRPLLRVVKVPGSDYWQDARRIVAGDAGRVLPWRLEMFHQNLGMSEDIESVFSYDPMWIGRYHEFTSYVDHRDAVAYDLLRARYLISLKELTSAETEASSNLVGTGEDLWVYERPNAYPEAWLVHETELESSDERLLRRLNDSAFDGRQTALVEEVLPCPLTSPENSERVEVLSRTNNRLVLEVDADGDALLVLSEVAYPGWNAYVDNERVPVVRADFALRAACVPVGSHRVTFAFEPASLRVGAGVSVFGCFVVCAAALSELTRRRRGAVEARVSEVSSEGDVESGQSQS
jgi:hypothetical protein